VGAAVGGVRVAAAARSIADPRDRCTFAGLAPWRPPSYAEADVSDKPAWLRARPLMSPSLIAKVDELGGSVNAIEFITKEIGESAFGYHERYRSGQDVVVGVNKFRTVGEAHAEPEMEITRASPQAARDAAERGVKLRRHRDAAKAARALRALSDAAAGKDNLQPHIREAVGARGRLRQEE